MTNRDRDARFEKPEQVIPWAIEQWVRQHMHTGMPGLVESYNATTKRAVVQPVFMTRFRGTPADPDPAPVEKPPILNVPVKQTATGGYMMHQQINVGDVVWLAFSERGLDAFKAAWGSLAMPAKGAYFQMRDAMAIPWGQEDIAPVSNEGIVFQSADGDTYIQIVDGAVRIVVGDTSIVLNGTTITASGPTDTLVIP